jgi:hypothetical protein
MNSKSQFRILNQLGGIKRQNQFAAFCSSTLIIEAQRVFRRGGHDWARRKHMLSVSFISLCLVLLGGGLFLARAAGATLHYVDVNNITPSSPYVSWSTAATNIQDAVDLAESGDEILVTNGVYQTGVRAVNGLNRVAVTKPVTVRSVNGPSVTQIKGYQMPAMTNGPAAVRCVYLSYGAVLAGFTLTNGATQDSGDLLSQYGGGVLCGGLVAVVSNCVLAGNSAHDAGGGSCDGTLNHCVLIGNSVGWSGGGAFLGTLNNCTLMDNSAGYDSGGASSSVLNNCILIGNSAGLSGGGAGGLSLLTNCVLTGNSAGAGGGTYYGTLNNCTLTGNSADQGGGAYESTLNNCTLTGNSAEQGGGAYESGLNNCIIYYNSATSGANYKGGVLYYCCTTPLPVNCCTALLPAGKGNLTNAPLFVDTNGWSNLRLQTNSPCINAGLNTSAPGPNDFDGNPRIAGGTVDIGAYEFPFPTSVISYAWLQQYGLPTDGSADTTDPDQDGLNNWQEWQGDTDPTNSLSVAHLRSITVVGSLVTMQFLSSSNYLYTFLYTTNLSETSWTSAPGYADVRGTGGWLTLYDKDLGGSRIYRLSMRLP